MAAMSITFKMAMKGCWKHEYYPYD